MTSAWKCPEPNSEARLRLQNSFTKKKDLFVPINGNEVRWYICGPTVYDTSHMGHARSYISFDILRRVLQDYFGYDVLFCMNVTDIDDKIIKRARERHLLKKYIDDSSLAIEKILEDCQLALKNVKDVRARETDKDKQGMYDKQISTAENAFQTLNGLTDVGEKRKKLFEDCRDILASYLDANYDHKSNPLDNDVFLQLARHYESEFHNDMARLNVLPANTLTRVSEYVPEIVKFIEKIIANGYAYESNSSVYFDTIKFHKQHAYAKLEPDRMGDLDALNEGEGALTSSSTKEKKNECDFVLWKKSKSGEPVWQSPWGLGRPGWHIECSVMASAILGPQFDIHTGGIDLKFPHHDNEIAQSEAHFDSDSWVNYFLHSGHLTIAGCKMSKSLKNFITIQQALEKYTFRQIRLLFLLHSWSSTLDYSDHGMEKALSYEKMLNEFFLNIKTQLRSMKPLNHSDAYAKFTEYDITLNERLSTAKKQVHSALCDSIDTPTVMEHIRQLVSATNIYMNDKNITLNNLLLRNIATYITRILDMFGLNLSSTAVDQNIGFSRSTEQKTTSVNVEEIAMPYVEQFALFRDAVRAEAITVKNKEILTLCDHVRNEVLPELGVRLEDHAGSNRATIKFVDPEVLRREREQAALVEKSKQEEKERRKLEQQRAKEAKEAKKKKNGTQEPTATAATTEIPNGATALANGDSQ